MTDIVIVHTNTALMLFVTVPEFTKNHTLIESHSYFPSPRIEYSTGGIDIPMKGPWEMLGRADALPEFHSLVLKSGKALTSTIILKHKTII